MNSNEQTLAGMDAFALGVFNQLAIKADPILREKLAAAGVSDLKALEREAAGLLLRDSLVEAAAGHFVGLDIESFRRVVDALFDPKWTAAWSRARKLIEENQSAFDMAVGPDIAVALAGMGVSVLPLDKKTMRPLAAATRDWRDAERIFGRFKSAFVGYDTTSAPFYVMITDSLNTMNEVVRADVRLGHALQAVKRTPYDFKNSLARFQHAALLLPRDPNDRFETVFLEDPRETHGSVMFLAGWREDGEPQGTSNDGLFAMPVRAVQAIFQHPAFIAWVNSPSDSSVSMH